MRYPKLQLLLTLIVVAVVGCGDDDPVQPVPLPDAGEVVVTANSRNVLSSVVTFNPINADSARVAYWKPGGPRLWTPTYPLAGGEAARIVTLGLEPQVTYQHQVELIGPNGESVSDSVGHTTGALPAYLADRVFVFVPPNLKRPDGYVMTNLRGTPDGLFSVIFDYTGRIVWYREWDLLGAYFEQHENGNFLTFIGTTTGFDPSYGYYAELQPDGEVVRRYQANAPLYTDNHDILLDFDGSGGATSHLISYDIRTIDLTALGGPGNALVAGHQILRFGPGGTTRFMWNIWDHFGMEYWISGRQPVDCTTCDYDHPNSLDLDLDGNYIYSIRNFSEVTKIDSGTGSVIWRLGGAGNQFTFVDDPFGGFNWQHSARITDSGTLLIYDNGNDHIPPETRVVEYELDEINMTATLVWEFRWPSRIFTGFLGSVQRLENGNTFIGYGAAGIAAEVTPAGGIRWQCEVEVDNKPAATYRYIKIASLYEYLRP